MVNHVWRFVGKTEYSKIYVDYTRNTTKIEGFKYTYYHKGIYPYHNPDYFKRYKNK